MFVATIMYSRGLSKVRTYIYRMTQLLSSDSTEVIYYIYRKNISTATKRYHNGIMYMRTYIRSSEAPKYLLPQPVTYVCTHVRTYLHTVCTHIRTYICPLDIYIHMYAHLAYACTYHRQGGFTALSHPLILTFCR